MIIPTAIIAILSWFGSGAQIIKLIKEYWEERKSRIKLDAEYDIKGNPQQYIALTEHEMTGHGNVKKRVLRIQVFNDSDGVAENCKARFQLIENENKEFPEHELKYLRWAYEDKTELTIYAQGDESLNVVFCTDKKIHGMNTFVAHPDSINEPNVPRKKDGFELDSHVFEVRINPMKGNGAKFKFRIDVNEDWQKTSMVKIR